MQKTKKSLQTRERLRKAFIEGSEAAAWKRFKRFGRKPQIFFPMDFEHEVLKRALKLPSEEKLAKLGFTSPFLQKRILITFVSFAESVIALEKLRKIAKEKNTPNLLADVQRVEEQSALMINRNFEKLFNGNRALANAYLHTMHRELKKLRIFEKTEPLPPHVETFLDN